MHAPWIRVFVTVTGQREEVDIALLRRAVFPDTVLLVNVRVFVPVAGEVEEAMPPPDLAALCDTVLSGTASTPLLLIPPPR